jgi:hypothetical protein
MAGIVLPLSGNLGKELRFRRKRRLSRKGAVTTEWFVNQRNEFISLIPVQGEEQCENKEKEI